MTSEHNYVENEIKSFVYQIFGFFDKHVDVEQILNCLVDRNLVMDFPGTEIRSAQDFRQWYCDVERDNQWNIHNIEKIGVQNGEQGKYEVDILLRWQALSRKNSQIGVYLVIQQWFLVESKTGLKIERYIVKEFTQLPAPQFF